MIMMKKIILSICISFFTVGVYANLSAQVEFRQIFENKKILHAYREKNHYDLICTEYVDQGENRPANFYFNAEKNTVSFIYMERNEYPIRSIEKRNGDFIITLGDGSLKFKVHRINDRIYAWNTIPADALDTMYTLFYKKSWGELKINHVLNMCKSSYKK